MYECTTEQSKCMTLIKQLTKDMRINNGLVNYSMDMDKVKISFPDRGSESEKASCDVRDILESEYPDVVEEWLDDEERDRENNHYYIVEGWWK